MRLLGAVLAGGGSRRFGSDKAQALLAGRRLIDLSAAALAEQVDALIVCGRVDAAFECIADRPAPGLGPLGGLCAALHHALGAGYDAVLTVGCDTPLLPMDLAKRLSCGVAPAACHSLPLIGLWPSTLALQLDAHLVHGVDRSMRRWIRMCGARSIDVAGLVNVNEPADLSGLTHAH